MFVNPRARKGRSAAKAKAALDALGDGRGADAVQVIDTASPAEVEREARRLVAGGCERIVVLGGDGLVHHVVQAVAGSGTVLGVVPIGSGNDFAFALGLSTHPAEAARVALGPARTIDLLRTASADGTTKWAASVATVGFSAAVNERAEAMVWPRGAARYSMATLVELPRLRSRSLVVRLHFADGSTQERRLDTALVAVANTAWFGGGMRICPAARPEDGLLDVTVIGSVGRISLLRHFGRVFRGTHVTHPAVDTFQLAAVTLTPSHRRSVGADSAGADSDGGRSDAVRADGEAWATLPLRIDIAPGTLQVAAPPKADKPVVSGTHPTRPTPARPDPARPDPTLTNSARQ